jgi:hypothetical protein
MEMLRNCEHIDERKDTAHNEAIIPLYMLIKITVMTTNL